MKYSCEKICNTDFLILDLCCIWQKNKCFFLSKMAAKDMINMFTVEPAEYDIAKQSAIAEKFDDDKDYHDHIILEKKKKIEEQNFQRTEDKSKINKIAQYIDQKEFAFFPNTIIATCDLYNNLVDNEDDECFEKYLHYISTDGSLNCAYLLQNGNDKYKLYIPYRKQSILIIDGQHRIKGLSKSKIAPRSKYELIVSFLINFDRAVIAQQFYTINFTPKKVNKSMLLHLMGEFDSDLPELTFLHEVVRVLNEVKASPFNKRIKMLGNVDKTLSAKEQSLQTISQAYLIDTLYLTISSSPSKSIHQPIFSYYFYNRRIERIEIQRFLIKFFLAISRLKNNDWYSPESIICKAMCIGALIRVMQIYFVIKAKHNDYNPLWIHEITATEIQEDLISFKDFNLSRYQGISSASSLNKLKKDIIEKTNFFDTSSYDDEFLPRYIRTYLKDYREWFADVVSPIVQKEKEPELQKLIE